eukprot:gene3205-5933_t
MKAILIALIFGFEDSFYDLTTLDNTRDTVWLKDHTVLVANVASQHKGHVNRRYRTRTQLASPVVLQQIEAALPRTIRQNRQELL